MIVPVDPAAGGERDEQRVAVPVLTQPVDDGAGRWSLRGASSGCRCVSARNIAQSVIGASTVSTVRPLLVGDDQHGDARQCARRLPASVADAVGDSMTTDAARSSSGSGRAGRARRRSMVSAPAAARSRSRARVASASCRRVCGGSRGRARRDHRGDGNDGDARPDRARAASAPPVADGRADRGHDRAPVPATPTTSPRRQRAAVDRIISSTSALMSWSTAATTASTSDLSGRRRAGRGCRRSVDQGRRSAPLRRRTRRRCRRTCSRLMRCRGNAATGCRRPGRGRRTGTGASRRTDARAGCPRGHRVRLAAELD